MTRVPSRLRVRWWAVRNRLRGYELSPVERFRCCSHTTPYHYRWCSQFESRIP